MPSIVGELDLKHFLGYSWLSSQYGLTIDNVAYELVLPNGTVSIVTSDDNDLWFGLKVSSRQARYRLVSLMAFDCREG